MADWNDNRTRSGLGTSDSFTGASVPRTREVFDAGLRSYMLSIYNYMTSGLLLTGVVAMLFYNSGLFNALFLVQETARGAVVRPTLLGWVVTLAPLGFVVAMNRGRESFSTNTLRALFWGFSAVMGLSLSYILALFTGSSIAATFFATAGAFAGLSLWGYTTKKDISAWGSFLIMGVCGLIISMLLNVFLIRSGPLDLAISFIGVLIFAGLTAWDTQRLKASYAQLRGTELAGKIVVLGAVSLYLDFINMFLFLLRFMGNRR